MIRHLINRLIVRVRWGALAERITATAGDNVPAEIEYLDRHGKVVGFWAYGYFHPGYPYRGQGERYGSEGGN